jgi:biopolymer transport protein ExbD
MKFPRNTRIFRGQLDVAPVACVFFMTALLLFLHSQIAFVPGLRLDLQPANTNKATLFIDAENTFHYYDPTNGAATYSHASFMKKMRADAEKFRAPATIQFEADLSAATNSINDVRALAGELAIGLEAPGTRIELPELPDEPGSRSASVIVAVNLAGQFFYENQLIDEKDLRPRLKKAVSLAQEPLTLVLRLDRAVDVDILFRLTQMARESGFRDVLVGSREPLKPMDPLPR